MNTANDATSVAHKNAANKARHGIDIPTVRFEVTA